MNKFWKKFKLDGWNLGISEQNLESLMSSVSIGGTIHLSVKWMKHRHRNSFYADPFIFDSNENEIRVLAEEYFYSRSKGVVSLLSIAKADAKLKSRQIVLEETCHLSYPCYDRSRKIFQPESFRNGNWAEYTFDGKKVSNKRVVADFALIDATPVEHNGMWYIFATSQPHALDELLIYYSEKREGPYQPHLLNPVKKDIKTSRCGGVFFTFNGALFRPVQDSTHRYGETVHIMRITDLSPTHFAEELYCHISIDNPEKYALGFHTINCNSDFIVVDGYKEVFRPLFVLYMAKVKPLIKKMFHAKH